MTCFVCEDNPEKQPFCPRCGRERFKQREDEDRYQTDKYYRLACEYAKEDYYVFGIIRTDEEIDREAKKLRDLIPPK